jgi:hypothetical protein
MASLVTRACDALATSAMRAIATYAVTSSVPAVLAGLISAPRTWQNPRLS